MIDPSILRRLAPAIAVGAGFTGSIFAGALLGAWLDRALGTSPWLALGLSLVGLASGTTFALRAQRRQDVKPPDDPPQPPPP